MQEIHSAPPADDREEYRGHGPEYGDKDAGLHDQNAVFLSMGLAWAEVLEADAIYAGVNAIDYSGYPDCRPEYIAAFQAMANLATKRTSEGKRLDIRTPLINLSKSEIVQLGTSLGVDFSLTVSCYSADASGAACGECDACELRREGFVAAGIADPTLYQEPASVR